MGRYVKCLLDIATTLVTERELQALCYQCAREKSLPLPLICRNKWDKANTQWVQSGATGSQFSSSSQTEPCQALYSPVSHHASSGNLASSSLHTDHAPSLPSMFLPLQNSCRLSERTLSWDHNRVRSPGHICIIAFLWERCFPCHCFVCLVFFNLHLSKRGLQRLSLVLYSQCSTTIRRPSTHMTPNK